MSAVQEQTIDKLRYTVHSYPMEEIFHDNEFNMRGRIAPIDVLDLANDIKERGLDFPITLQPFSHPVNEKIKWRIVSGHRRHIAFRVNGATHIPAFVRTDLTEISARMFNMRENILREETNVKQEAKHVGYFLKHGLTEETMGEMLGQSRGWVQVRVALLKLPEDIQEVAASGVMTQEQIRFAARLKDKNKLYEFVKKIKEAKERGQTLKPAMSIARTQDVLKSKARNKTEIAEMKDIIYDAIGPSLATRALAWAEGEISTSQVHQSIKDEAKEKGINYEIPDYVNRALSGSQS